MKTKTLGFIGGGRITKIFLQALKNKNADLSKISVSDIDNNVLSSLRTQFPKIQISDSSTPAAFQEVVFIALHPPVIMEELNTIKDIVKKNSIVISLAPKINIEKISGVLATNKIVRMIPNATSYINEGYNPVCFSSNLKDKEKESIIKWLSQLGKTFEVEEKKLEAYAIISAMLPTYFWFQWKELLEIGQQMGLDSKESDEAIEETLKSAIQLFNLPNLTKDEIIDLIPVRPIAEHENTIKACFKNTLIPLYEKIKP